VKHHQIAIQSPQQPVRAVFNKLRLWFDAHSQTSDSASTMSKKVDWVRVSPFVLMHLMCFTVIWVGWSPIALAVAISLYFLRMLAITGFYHRYFSHKTFRTSRISQFIFAVLGASAAQRGPLWWASHHRHHHAHSDTKEDPHSPGQHGFLWSHIGWFTDNNNFAPKMHRVSDLVKFRELVWLDRFDVIVPFALAVALYLSGEFLEKLTPSLNTSGPQMLIWGFFISTVALYHATYTVNSLAHKFGNRRYNTKDDSRNSFLIALITCGEGWHNNHHHFPGSVRQGFYWWEVDLTYYFLKLLAWAGIIWDLKSVPEELKNSRRVKKQDLS